MSSPFIGSGRIRVATYDDAVPFAARDWREVGNVSAFTFNFTETKQELRDYRDPAGGVDSSTSRIETVNAQMDMRHFSAENLALALWGDANALAATAITGEAQVCKLGQFIPTDRLINTSVAPVLKKGATVIDTGDYTVNDDGSGITWAASVTTSGLVDGDDITIDYTPQAGNDVQALINAAPNVSIFFAGINTVTGKAATVRLYKCKVGVAADVSLIGDDFGTLQVTATVEKDETITGSGLSKFLQLQEAT